MLLYLHESVEFGWAGNRQGEAISSDKAGPGREGRHEGRRSIAGFGGPETGICNRCTRVNPYDFGALHSCGEPGGSPGFGAEAPSGASDRTDSGYEAAIGTGFAEETSGIWPTPADMGRANAGNSPERTFWGKGESPASREVDA